MERETFPLSKQRENVPQEEQACPEYTGDCYRQDPKSPLLYTGGVSRPLAKAQMRAGGWPWLSPCPTDHHGRSSSRRWRCWGGRLASSEKPSARSRYLPRLACEGSWLGMWFTAWRLDAIPRSASGVVVARNATSSRKGWLEPGSWRCWIEPLTDLDVVQAKPPSSRNRSAALRILFWRTSGRNRPSFLLVYPWCKARPCRATRTCAAFPGISQWTPTSCHHFKFSFIAF